MKESKSFDLLKVLGITFVVILLLSWVIPAGAYSSGAFQSLNATAPIGLYDLIRTPAITIATFIQYGLLFLAIGAFYGVLNKIGVYSNVVNAIVKKWSGNKKGFLILTTVLFALLASLTGLLTVMFILVPFFVAILMKLGYKKLPIFASTVGAMLVGQMGTTFGFNVWGYLMVFFSQSVEISMTTMIVARAILLVMLVTIFVIIISKGVKKEETTKKEKKEEEIPLYEEATSKKGSIPFIIVSILMFVILVLGMYNWSYATSTEIFYNLHDSITSFEISGYPIFANLLGSVSELGYWGNYDLVVILVLASLLLGWIYSVKFKEILSGMANGVKKMLPTAFYAMLSCVVFASILNMSDGNFVATIVNKLLSNQENFSFLGTVGSSLVASFAYNDFYTLVGTFYGVLSLYDAATIPVIAVLVQTIYGLVMLIAPTSIFLLAGLAFMEIPYKEWMKYIWKFALIAFGLILVVSFILTM